MSNNDLSDKSQLGLSAEARSHLDRIAEELQLTERMDGYRFAIAAAIAKGLSPAGRDVSRTNAYNAAGSLDPDGQIKAAVLAVRDDHEGRPYALVERLAEAGLRDIFLHINSGHPIREYLTAVRQQ